MALLYRSLRMLPTPAPVSPTPAPTPTLALVPFEVAGYQTDDPLYARLWGPGLQRIDVLSNVRIGRPTTTEYIHAHRFKAAYGGHLASLRQYFEDGVGYALGNGGQIRIRVFPDDGTSSHRPDMTGTPLAEGAFDGTYFSMSGGSFVGSPGWADVSVTSATPLVAGQRYHVVYDNVDANPAANYVSINIARTRGATGRPNPWTSPWDWGTMYGTRGSPYTGAYAWSEWTNSTISSDYASPILQITYASGDRQGYAVIESGNVEPSRLWRVTSTDPVRERFSPLSTKTVSGFTVETAKESGTGALSWALKQGGTTIVDGTIADPGNDYTTVTLGSTNGIFIPRHVLFTDFVTMTGGLDYDLEFTAAGSSEWVFTVLRNGGQQGFVYPAAFTQSQAEHWTGSEWIGSYHWNHAVAGTFSNWRVVLHTI
jgi:hypothetical protein